MSRKAMQEILDRFNECVFYKVYRDLVLYGECVLDTSKSAYRNVLIKELIEVRKMLDDG